MSCTVFAYKSTGETEEKKRKGQKLSGLASEAIKQVGEKKTLNPFIFYFEEYINE